MHCFVKSDAFTLNGHQMETEMNENVGSMSAKEIYIALKSDVSI